MLDKINSPQDLKNLNIDEMNQLAMDSENALTDVQRALGELRILQEAKIPEISYQKDELLNQVLDLGIDIPQELNELDQMSVDAETIDADAYDLVSKVEDLRVELYKFML